MNEADEKRLSDLAVTLALGRIFRLGSRPTQPGDIEEYERCRALIIGELGDAPEGYRPNWARDRHGSVMRGEE